MPIERLQSALHHHEQSRSPFFTDGVLVFDAAVVRASDDGNQESDVLDQLRPQLLPCLGDLLQASSGERERLVLSLRSPRNLQELFLDRNELQPPRCWYPLSGVSQCRVSQCRLRSVIRLVDQLDLLPGM